MEGNNQRDREDATPDYQDIPLPVTSNSSWETVGQNVSPHFFQLGIYLCSGFLPPCNEFIYLQRVWLSTRGDWARAGKGVRVCGDSPPHHGTFGNV